MKGSVSISLVEVYKRVGKSVIAVCETQGLERPDRRIFGREKKKYQKTCWVNCLFISKRR